MSNAAISLSKPVTGGMTPSGLVIVWAQSSGEVMRLRQIQSVRAAAVATGTVASVQSLRMATKPVIRKRSR